MGSPTLSLLSLIVRARSLAQYGGPPQSNEELYRVARSLIQSSLPTTVHVLTISQFTMSSSVYSSDNDILADRIILPFHLRSHVDLPSTIDHKKNDSVMVGAAALVYQVDGPTHLPPAFLFNNFDNVFSFYRAAATQTENIVVGLGGDLILMQAVLYDNRHSLHDVRPERPLYDVADHGDSLYDNTGYTPNYTNSSSFELYGTPIQRTPVQHSPPTHPDAFTSVDVDRPASPSPFNSMLTTAHSIKRSTSPAFSPSPPTYQLPFRPASPMHDTVFSKVLPPRYSGPHTSTTHASTPAGADTNVDAAGHSNDGVGRVVSILSMRQELRYPSPVRPGGNISPLTLAKEQEEALQSCLEILDNPATKILRYVQSPIEKEG